MKQWLFALSLIIFSLHGEERVQEKLYKDWGQSFQVQEIIYEERTEFQDLVIFQNNMWGKVLVLDGVIQLTEKDEFIYHEMMAHVPLIAHGSAETVLVIGGGDGGVLRECLKHSSIKKIVLVEIDPEVVFFSKKYLSFISQGSLDSPLVEIVIADGMEYVRSTTERFDVILCDSTDPEGPAEVLFTEEFYKCCKNILKEKGIFVNQAGVPALQGESLKMICSNLRKSYQSVSFYLGVIPTYIGGYMAFGFATKGDIDLPRDFQEIKSRVEKIQGNTLYYNAKVHQSCFSLPNFIWEIQK